MRSLLALSAVYLSCAPATTLTVGADRTNAMANGSDAVTISATITSDGKPVSDFVDFTTSGGQLSATHVQADAMGVAKTSLTSTTAGSVTVTATLPGKQLTGSALVTFNTATVPRLSFQVSPSNTMSQNLLRPIPVVVVLDNNGMTMSSSTASVTVSVTPGTCGGASLDSTSLMTVNAQNGSASFYGLKITTPATGCTLTATSSGFASAVSSAFDIIQ